MNQKIQPYLQSLRTSVATISVIADASPAHAKLCASISGDLLDRMKVDRGTAIGFRLECYATMTGLLPVLETVLAGSSANEIAELKTICNDANVGDFDRFEQLAGMLRKSLAKIDTESSASLKRAIVKIETDYTRKFDLARRAQCAQSAALGKTASGARNVRTIDEAAMLTFIRSAFPSETMLDIKNSGFVSGGFSKFTAFINLTNTKSLPEQLILRGDAAASYGGASVIDEFRLFNTLYAQGVCLPKPLALEATGKVFGSPFMLVEKRPGVSMGHMFDLPTEKNKSLLENVAAHLVTIHRIPLNIVGDQMDGAKIKSSEKAIQWIDDAEGKWKPLGRPSPAFETAFEWLRANAGLNDKAPRTLVHGDYSLHNFLMHDNKVSAILDWEFAHVGNPAYDLGYFYPMARALSSWEDFLRAYEKAGAPVPGQDQLNYNILFAVTRLGVMVCQAVAAFRAGIETGLAATVSTSGGYYEETILRISDALDQVM